MKNQFKIGFHPSGRGKAQCPADPNYPDGKVLVISDETIPNCVVDLPYPASECGMFIIECSICKIRAAITAVGRRDDPRRLSIPCKLENQRTN